MLAAHDMSSVILTLIK